MTNKNILQEVLNELKEEVPKLTPVGICKRDFQADSNNIQVAQLNTIIKLLLVGNVSLNLYNQKLEELNSRVRNLELILPSLETIKSDTSNINLISKESDLAIYTFLTKIGSNLLHLKNRIDNLLERDKSIELENIQYQLNNLQKDKGKEKIIYKEVNKEPVDYTKIIGPIKIIKK